MLSGLDMFFADPVQHVVATYMDLDRECYL